MYMLINLLRTIFLLANHWYNGIFFDREFVKPRKIPSKNLSFPDTKFAKPRI